MPVISIDRVAPGSVLSRDIVDRHGRLLLPEGRPLSDRHVEVLRIWGVEFVEVEGTDEFSAPSDIPPEDRLRAEEELRSRFRHLPEGHPLVRELFDAAVRRKLARGGGGG